MVVENSTTIRDRRSSEGSTPFPGDSTILSQSDKNAWILYTAVAAIVLIVLIVAILLYDLFSRCCQRRDQVINDSGPPVSPTHQHSYTITLRVDEASAAFETKTTILKMDLLDSCNQYLTSIAIPCFVLKFKTIEPTKHELKSLVTAAQHGETLPPQQVQQLHQFQQLHHQLEVNKNLPYYKSLSGLHDTWSNTTPSSAITFRLVRRMPLIDFYSVRVSHDCYNIDAFIRLKNLSIKEDNSGLVAKISFTGKDIRAHHPCPPSGLNIYTLDKVVKK